MRQFDDVIKHKGTLQDNMFNCVIIQKAQILNWAEIVPENTSNTFKTINILFSYLL